MADFTAATIAVLQPLIKKPTLKPALLQKPPFRFLHDIITNLQSSPTPFPPAQLFASDQLVSENVASKEQKIAFLSRVVEVVEAVLGGGKLDVSAAKIIAGLEAEKTNVMLQQLAAAAQKGLSEDEIVSRVQGGGAARRNSTEAEAKPPAAKPAAAKPAAAAAPTPAAAAPKPAPAPVIAQPAASPEQSPQPTTRPKAGSISSASSSAAPSARPSQSSRTPIPLPPAPTDTPEDFTQTTQRLLGSLITKPSLKPNLLQKPPFRFLHDIVTSLIASTANYPAEYFSAEESDSAALDSSEKKMGWLKRLVDVVEATTGEDLSGVQPKKIVAGLEADKTNLLLQALARAAASGVPAKEAIERRQGGGKTVEAESKTAEPAAKPASKATPVKATAPAAAATTAVAAGGSPQVPKLALKSVDEPPPIVAPQVPGMEQEGAGRLERPMTARQGPPKAKPVVAAEEKAEVREEKEADPRADAKPTASSSSNKAAAAAVDKRKGLIVEGEQVEEEDEIAEEPVDTQQAEQSIKQFEEEQLDASEQGNLMRKILQSTNPTATTADQPAGAPTLATLTPASSADDRTSALRQQLQRLCQSITPLGRVMECVVDDMDEMGRERSRWRKQREEYEGGVEGERAASVRVLEPLQVQLEECERRLVEWERKVMVQKSVLWRNEQNISKMMQQKVAGES